MLAFRSRERPNKLGQVRALSCDILACVSNLDVQTLDFEVCFLDALLNHAYLGPEFKHGLIDPCNLIF